jgi:hypothetical protein
MNSEPAREQSPPATAPAVPAVLATASAGRLADAVSIDAVLGLQRTAGNQAVSRWMTAAPRRPSVRVAAISRQPTASKGIDGGSQVAGTSMAGPEGTLDVDRLLTEQPTVVVVRLFVGIPSVIQRTLRGELSVTRRQGALQALSPKDADADKPPRALDDERTRGHRRWPAWRAARRGLRSPSRRRLPRGWVAPA